MDLDFGKKKSYLIKKYENKSEQILFVIKLVKSDPTPALPEIRNPYLGRERYNYSTNVLFLQGGYECFKVLMYHHPSRSLDGRGLGVGPGSAILAQDRRKASS